MLYVWVGFTQFMLRLYLVVLCMLSSVGVPQDMRNYFRGSFLERRWGNSAIDRDCVRCLPETELLFAVSCLH